MRSELHRRLASAQLFNDFASFAHGANARWSEPALRFAMQLHHCPPVVRVKNASDIELAVHAMDFLQTHPHDGFVVVSSDCDFFGAPTGP